MYSYEDRIRAVRLYLKLGKRIRATIRQLGCPTCTLNSSPYQKRRFSPLAVTSTTFFKNSTRLPLSHYALNLSSSWRGRAL